MRIRVFLTIAVLSFSVTQLQALPTLQDLDLFAGRVITNVAGYSDSIGAYFNLCRAPLGQVISDTTSAVAEHVSNFDVTAALHTTGKAITQASDESLPYAPTTTFAQDNMREIKVALVATIGVIVATFSVLMLKRALFPKKPKKNREV